VSGATPAAGAATLDRSLPPGPGVLRPFHFPPLERLALSNGMPLLFAQVHGLPVVTMGLLLRAGGIHEPAERAGVASLTSSLLESGTASRSAGDIADALERLGVQLSVSASWDVAYLELTGLRSRMEAGAGIAADLLRHPTFPEAEVERLRQEQLARILQRRADPRSLANEMATRFIFAASSPFSRSLSGSAGTVSALARGDVASFHATRYSPHGGALLIAGDLDTAEAQALAENHFGDWAGPPPAGVQVAVESRGEQREIFIVHRPGAVQSEIRVGEVGVARDTPDYFPLLVMNTILGGAFTSRLNLNLREKHGFTYGVSSAFGMRRAPGPFTVATAVQTEVTASALAEIFREVAAIREAPVTDAELRDARTYVAGVFPLRLQTTEGVVSRLAELALYDLPDDYFDQYRAEVAGVTAEQVLRAAREHLHPERMAVVVVGDADRIRAPLEALGLGPVQVVTAGADA
jgi:zinc protease